MTPRAPSRPAPARSTPSRLARLALALLPLAGCADPGVTLGSIAGANMVSVMLIGRDIPDAVVSLVSGKDCSVVRIDLGQTYCRPTDPPVAALPYCTRSLGSVDCWKEPPLTDPPRPTIADQSPRTTAQEAWRTRRWPGLQ